MHVGVVSLFLGKREGRRCGPPIRITASGENLDHILAGPVMACAVVTPFGASPWIQVHSDCFPSASAGDLGSFLDTPSALVGNDPDSFQLFTLDVGSIALCPRCSQAELALNFPEREYMDALWRELSVCVPSKSSSLSSRHEFISC